MRSLLRNDLGTINYSWWEWAIMRIGMAWLCFDTGETLWKTLRASKGVRDEHGIGRFFDIEFLLEPGVWQGLEMAWWILLIAYVLNVFPILTVSGLLSIHVLAGTFYMSQGAMHHSQQIISLIWIGHLAALIYSRFKVKGNRLPSLLFPNSPEERRWMVFGCQQMIAAAYVITGLTKHIRSDGDWIEESPNLVIQFEKNLTADYYNKLIPPDERATEWMIEFINGWPLVAMVFFAFVLALEFFAFLALYNRKLLALWGLSLIAMHLSIGVIMKLDFYLHEMALLFFWVNLPGWVKLCFSRGRDSVQAA